VERIIERTNRISKRKPLTAAFGRAWRCWGI
jgi:hypothetical protein